jgi:HEAT repeat protein
MDLSEKIGAIDQRFQIIVALARIGPPDAVIPALREVVESESETLGIIAAETLGELRPDSEPVLRELLSHHEERVQNLAEMVLTDPSPEE